jgi:hypothetical protein
MVLARRKGGAIRNPSFRLSRVRDESRFSSMATPLDALDDLRVVVGDVIVRRHVAGPYQGERSTSCNRVPLIRHGRRRGTKLPAIPPAPPCVKARKQSRRLPKPRRIPWSAATSWSVASVIVLVQLQEACARYGSSTTRSARGCHPWS